ncbi:MAG: hypothetical protein R3C59_16985 [Planctomycetaceae bacterium]
MGLFNLLTKPIKLTSAHMHWHEPWLFRVRLRNDLWIRLLIVLGGWFGAAGVLLLLFSINRNPPGVWLAFGLGLVGAGMTYMVVLGRRPHVSGSCWIYPDKLSWQSLSSSIGGFQGNWAEWDFEAIDACIIFQPRHLNKPFGVMLICADGDEYLIGIPNSVNLKEVGKLLIKSNVSVTVGQQLPQHFIAPLRMPFGLAVPAAGLTLLAVGWIAMLGHGGDVQRPVVTRPDVPQFEPVQGLPPRGELPGMNTKPAEHSQQPMTANSGIIQTPAPNLPSGNLFPDGFSVGSEMMRNPQFPPAMTPSEPQVGPIAASPAAVANAQAMGTDSELLGGAGGGPFRTVSPNGQPIVAVQFSMGSWAGKERVSRLTPLFTRPPVETMPQLIVARNGYALGGLEVDAGDLVDAMRLQFMRIGTDGNLVADDSYKSDWLGTPNQSNVRILSSDGAPAVGIYGRGAAVLDAVGLVFAAPSR